MSLLSNFPENYTPSDQQAEVINKIEKAFASGKKFVVCCASTGAGKTFFSKTIANSSSGPSTNFKYMIDSDDAFKMDQFGDYMMSDDCKAEPPFGAFALTITKGLQDQYKALFEDTQVLKGKRNYLCTVDPRFEVEVAPCVFVPNLKKQCLATCSCPYYNARRNVLTNKFGALNYSMYMALPDHVKNKQYLVCDEASEIEDELVKSFSRSIDFKILKKLNIPLAGIPIADYSKFQIWLNNVIIILTLEVNSLKGTLAKTKNPLPSDLQKFTLFNMLLMSLQTTSDTWSDCEYLIEKTDTEITIKPLRVDTLSRHIFEHADKVLLMSATIIDHKNFTKTLGITEYEYIEAESTFDPKNAPILANTKLRLNYKNLKENLPKIVDNIIEICNHHKDVKGIIHTHTMEITEYIMSRVDNDRFLFRSPGMTNEQIVQEHIESQENTILVSPSLTYGIDLKEDLARFQIIVKAAWLPLGDQRIKRLSGEDPNWYLNKMLNNLVQACGRGVRTKKDKCVTYIMDASITDTVLRHKDKLPKYFVSRFR